MSKEQELIKQAERLASLPDCAEPFEQLKALLKDETDLEMRSRVITFFYIAFEEALCSKDHFNMLNNKVSKLINTYPLPDDAEEQLDHIIEQTDNAYERLLLGRAHEALFIQRYN